MRILKKKTKNSRNTLQKGKFDDSKLKVFVVLGAVFFLLITGILLYDNLRVRTAIKIDGEKYSLQDLKYYFYLIESDAEEADTYYKEIVGKSYWDIPYDDSNNLTLGDMAKSQIIDMALKYEVLYKEATSKNYSIREEYKLAAEKEIDEVLNNRLDDEDLKRMGFSKDYLTAFINKMALVDDYQDHIVTSFNIDEKAIKGKFNSDDYKQYDISYIWTSKGSQTSDGEFLELNEGKKKARYEKLKSLYSKAKTSDDWESLIDKDEEDLIFQKLGLNKEENPFSEEIHSIIVAMDNNEVSKILEDEQGYYVVKMKNNQSKEFFESVTQNAVIEESNKQFQEYFNSLADEYSYEVNNEYMKNIKVGTVTTN